MATAHRNTHFLSAEPTPQEQSWKAICDAAGTTYRGYLKPHTTPTGETLEAVVLFNDKQGLVVGLSVSAFHLKNVRTRFNECESRKPLTDRPSPIRVYKFSLRTLADSFGGRP